MILYKNKLQKVLIYFVKYSLLIFTSVLIILPLVVILSSAFKNESEIFTFPMTIIPDNIIYSNFTALAKNFPSYILNSVKLTTIIVFLQVITASMAGYAFAKIKWRFRGILFVLYISTMMIPAQVYIITQFVIVKNIGLYDSHMGIILISVFTAFGTFLCRQFFMTIPDSYIEAAKVDGAGHFYIFFKIILPLSKPVLATLVIFSFRFFWNDFFTPMIYLTSPELKTLPIGIADFVTETFTYYGPQMAASLISILPVLCVFLIAQKYIVEGVTASGIKG